MARASFHYFTPDEVQRWIAPQPTDRDLFSSEARKAANLMVNERLAQLRDAELQVHDTEVSERRWNHPFIKSDTARENIILWYEELESDRHFRLTDDDDDGIIVAYDVLTDISGEGETEQDAVANYLDNFHSTLYDLNEVEADMLSKYLHYQRVLMKSMDTLGWTEGLHVEYAIPRVTKTD